MNIRNATILGLTAAFIALPVIGPSPAHAQDTKKAATPATPKVGERIGDWVFQ